MENNGARAYFSESRNGETTKSEVEMFDKSGYQMDNYRTLLVNDKGEADWVAEVVSKDAGDAVTAWIESGEY